MVPNTASRLTPRPKVHLDFRIVRSYTPANETEFTPPKAQHTEPMSLSPLLHASLAVQIHVATVVPAFAIGTYQIFFSKKGEPYHRLLGYAYVVLMAVTCVDALFIHELMPKNVFYGFSPLHVLVLLTLACLVSAVRWARVHNIPRHRSAVLGSYIGGLLVATSLLLMPGRIMHAVFFG